MYSDLSDFFHSIAVRFNRGISFHCSIAGLGKHIQIYLLIPLIGIWGDYKQCFSAHSGTCLLGHIYKELSWE